MPESNIYGFIHRKEKIKVNLIMFCDIYINLLDFLVFIQSSSGIFFVALLSRVMSVLCLNF